MIWLVAGLIVFIALVYSFIEDLIVTCKNTYRAIKGTEKITYKSIEIWIITLTILMVLYFIILTIING